MSETGITVEKCSPHIGAEIAGVDLTGPLSNSEVDQIHSALNAHGVVFFRDQNLTPEDQDRFVRCLGEPHVHVGGKSTASKPVDGYPALRKQHFDENSARISGEAWHTDQSCAEIPPKYSVLYQEIIPPDGGGDTMFLSAAKAYDELSDSMKAYLDGKTAFHNADVAFDASVTFKTTLCSPTWALVGVPVRVAVPSALSVRVSQSGLVVAVMVRVSPLSGSEVVMA